MDRLVTLFLLHHVRLFWLCTFYISTISSSSSSSSSSHRHLNIISSTLLFASTWTDWTTAVDGCGREVEVGFRVGRVTCGRVLGIYGRDGGRVVVCGVVWLCVLRVPGGCLGVRWGWREEGDGVRVVDDVVVSGIIP
ncbi:hypothetical protein FA15DRAFT_149896 [Coprinopsis marcescibilis]|uniref:Transmembrane protein n=1 Tax=Coprinopsis marcescibilis TaxID=230819 RepID=A0A5C3KJD7_COPMA|nr:hypothetical protein FA15DRAFT_149896 [Coprinopsis marcescibilis]